MGHGRHGHVHRPNGAGLPDALAHRQRPAGSVDDDPNGSGDIRSNFAIVKLGVGGEVSVFSYQSTDVIIDLVGYFSNDSSGHGLFTPMTPHRVEDSA